MDGLPWRGPGPGRPDLPLPPEQMPLRHNRAWRKRWRYVAAFCDEAFVVAARVNVGLLGQTFWAVLDRRDGQLHERTRTRLPSARGEVWRDNADQSLNRVQSSGVHVKLRIGEGKWAEAVCPTSEGSYVWTRKRVGTPVGLEVRLEGKPRIECEALGVEDESAGYHPNPTEWFWSAGVGTTTDGRAVGWNLVSGINDPPARSERAIWIEGEPREPEPVEFDPELRSITFGDGSRMSFEAEGIRTAKQNLGLVSYDYRQPFGTFAGQVAGIDLASGMGVMEYHLARW